MGVTIVQEPKDAAYPEMPQSALNSLKVDHCVPLSEMGLLLEKLVQESLANRPIPEDIQTEAEIAERVLSDIAQVNTLSTQVPYTVGDAKDIAVLSPRLLQMCGQFMSCVKVSCVDVSFAAIATVAAKLPGKTGVFP